MSKYPQLEKVLVLAAREATKAAQHSGENCYGEVAAILKARLLALLEAGQVLRELDGGEQERRWDTALRAALMPRRNTNAKG